MRPEKTGFAFCDEAYSAHRYFALGALLFVAGEGSVPAKVVSAVERKIQLVKTEYGLGTIKWSKVPTKVGKKLDGYKALIDHFFNDKMHFKCMIVDTRVNPLDNRDLWGGDALIGYLKFYCVFLADGLMNRFPGYFYQITIDGYTFRTGDDCAQLERTIEGRYVNKSKPASAISHCRLSTSTEQESNLLQLTDLLLGAVAFVWNGGMGRSSMRADVRKEVVAHLEHKLKMPLSAPTSWATPKFNIWLLKPNPIKA
jgi:hypothetical protein